MTRNDPPADLRRAIRRWRHVPVPVRRVAVRTRRLSHHSRAPRPHVRVEFVDTVALITFDDAKVNVISRQSSTLLAAALDRIAAQRDVSAVVLAGRPGQFSAGFDLDALMIGGPDRDDLVRSGWEMLMRYYTVPLPLVVACTGHAVAAGAVLLLAGDQRIGAEGDYAIGFNEAAIGLPLPSLLLALAQDELNPDAFGDATAGARMFSPHEAVDACFLHRVVPADELIATAIAEARRMGSEPPPGKAAKIAERAALTRKQLPADLALMSHLEE